MEEPTDFAVDALEARLKYLEDELIRTQPEYEVKKKPFISRKIVPKTKAQVEEEMALEKQKALFGTVLPPIRPHKRGPAGSRGTTLSPSATEETAQRDHLGSGGDARSGVTTPGGGAEDPVALSASAPAPASSSPSSSSEKPKTLPAGGILGQLYQSAAATAEAQKPKVDPNALPLTPLFYNEKQEREFDRLIVDFDHPESKAEYEILVKTYAEYLGGEGEEELWALWKRLGGVNQWKKYLRPTQLTLLLSRETNIFKLRYRVNMEKLPYLDGFAIEEREASAFFSNVIPRLPKLEYLEIVDCPVNPFLPCMLDHVHNPFPALKGMYLAFVKMSSVDVIQLLKRYAKHMEKGKMRVDPKTLTFTNMITEKNIIALSNDVVSFTT